MARGWDIATCAVAHVGIWHEGCYDTKSNGGAFKRTQAAFRNWIMADGSAGSTGDILYGLSFARDIYTNAVPDMTGRVTVPILWDKERETIVNNENSEIIPMFNSTFDGIIGNTDDYWPEDMRDVIEEVNPRIYDTVNNGVYKSGFATTQTAYDAAVVPLFDTLDWLEDRLSKSRYLMGDRLTEADWRLWTTLVRPTDAGKGLRGTKVCD